MDSTLQALGGILLRAIPTVLIVLFLHFYLKRTFFRPLQEVLEKRYVATEGARQAAAASLAGAEQKTAAYEAALRDARAEVYKEQEELRRNLIAEHEASLRQARQQAGLLIRDAEGQLSAEVVKAKQDLAATSERLADQIAETVLRGRPA